jgi:hypothetical protein
VHRLCRLQFHPCKAVGQVQGIPNTVETKRRLLMALSC